MLAQDIGVLGFLYQQCMVRNRWDKSSVRFTLPYKGYSTSLLFEQQKLTHIVSATLTQKSYIDNCHRDSTQVFLEPTWPKFSKHGYSILGRVVYKPDYNIFKHQSTWPDLLPRSIFHEGFIYKQYMKPS